MSNDLDKNYTEKISCSKETKKLLEKYCVELYMDNHPEMKGKKITQGHIMRQVVEFYLREP